jgi:hypothetical protein
MYAKFFRSTPAAAPRGQSAREAPMSWSSKIRRFHRGTAVVFTVVVAIIFAILGAGKEPLFWLYYVPLLPLALLFLSGSYMFLRPYVAKRRGDRPQNQNERKTA